MSKTSEAIVFHTLVVPKTISKYQVQGLLCSAFEGGSNYWIESLELQLADGINPQDLREGGKYADPDEYWTSSQIAPFVEGCGVKINVLDEDDLGDTKPAILNIESMRKGLELMAASETYAHHWRDFVSENDDATTADVFLQFCIFGDVIFG